MIGFVRDEDIEPQERVDVTLDMVAHGLVVETFT